MMNQVGTNERTLILVEPMCMLRPFDRTFFGGVDDYFPKAVT